jgi:Trypsin-like peptidase domain
MRANSNFVTLLTLAAASCADTTERPELADEALRSATVAIHPSEPGECTGVIARDDRHVLTTLGCAGPGSRLLGVELRDGRRLIGTPVHRDATRGLAMLQLFEATSLGPMELANGPPQPGDAVIFVGRSDARTLPQVGQIHRPGFCRPAPREVEEPEAGDLLTNIVAREADAGSPLVDSSHRVVGLLDGTRTCRMVAPVSGWSGTHTGLLSAAR